MRNSNVQENIGKILNINYVPVSGDAKTGGIGATYSSYAFCPRTNCPWKEKCYGRHFPCCLHAKRVTEGKTGLSWTNLDYHVRTRGLNPYMVRVNVTGDLCEPGTDDLWRPLLEKHLEALGQTMLLYTYTHARLVKKNLNLMAEMGKKGFTINASCETLAQVKKARKAGIPAVLAVKSQPQGTVERDGIKFTTCPNYANKGIKCATCRLCARFNRDCVVVLPFHGKNKKEEVPDFLMDRV